MTAPNAFLVDKNGQTLRAGLAIAPNGAATLVTSDSFGNPVTAPIGASASAIARSTAQLAGTPSAADLALGGAAQFYDPQQSPLDATHPWVYYSATPTAYVPISNGGTGAVASVNGQTGTVVLTAGTLNALTLGTSLTASQIQSTLADGTPPTGNNTYINTTSGTTVMTGYANFTTLAHNDEVSYNGVTNQWQKIAAVDSQLRTAGMAYANADGTFSIAPASAFAPPVSLQMTLPLVVPPAWAAAPVNGVVIFASPGVPANTASGYYADGCLVYMPANLANGSNAAGWYFGTFSSATQVQLTTTVYTPGTPFSIPPSPTNMSGTGSAGAVPTATDILAYLVTGTNLLGPTGKWKTEFYTRNSGGANTKNVKTKINSSNVGYNISSSTSTVNGGSCTVSNKNKTNVQGAPYLDVLPLGATNSGSSAAVDTTASTTYGAYFNMSATATDYMVGETCTMTHTFGA